ncbi:MAG: ClpXP protease specificity-enhancing factor [Pseudomonadales bacterium]
MLSSKPYLLRALHEWILDNHCTPHLVVDALLQGVMVPQEHIKDGQIVLNISPSAVVGLAMGQDAVTFSARFGGVARNIHVPIYAIQGIYARENGQGMMFPSESIPDPDPSDGGGQDTPKPVPSRPALRVVK